MIEILVVDDEALARSAVIRQLGVRLPDARVREARDGFEALAGHWAFYAQALDECWVDDERVLPNDGNFYGGWVTANVTGPITGGSATTWRASRPPW